MKINSLLESQTPSSSVSNITNSSPEFGRDDEHLDETTTSGSVASVSAPVGSMQRRGKGSIFSGIKSSDKYPNSKVVKEGAYEDGVRDGIRGEANPRASSIYGPESGEYSRGYDDGLVKSKEQSQANVSAYQASLAPYKEIPTDKLKQMLRDIRKRSDEIQAIFNKYKGASLFGGDAPPNTEELRAEGKKNNEAWQAIHQELFQRGVPNDQRLEEADEWEEEGDKFQRFLAYAQKQLKEADPAQRISLARRLSVWQVKNFGPENNQSYNPNTGAAIQGNSNITPSIRAILEIINRPSGQTFSSTVASIPSPQQVEIDNSWRLTDEGKEWLAYAKEELQKAGVNSSDFMEVARALSQQQVKKFGRASMDTRNNITAEINMIIDKIRWLGVVATQQANQNIIDADLTVTELMDKYNNASPQEQDTFRAGVERDYGMSVQEFFDYLQEHDQLPQARKQSSPADDVFAEAKKANTKTARKEFGKRDKKPTLSDKEKESKQSESDRLWAMLQQHIADAEKNKDVKEGEEMSTFAALKDWRVWDVRVFNNYYRGKYADYGPRLYSVVASSPEEARQVVINNADYVLQDLLSRKLQNGKKVLPRGSALPVEEKRVGKADPGTITTMGLKKMLTPDGVQSFKFSNGKIVDGAHVQGGEQVEEANSFLKPGPQTTGKFPEPRKPSFQGDQGSKSETLGSDGLIYHWQDPRAKQGMAEAWHEPVDYIPKAPRKRKPQVGNRVADISVGSPKIYYKNGKAVGEVGIDPEASPGNGSYYMKHYLSGKALIGYDTPLEASKELSHMVRQENVDESLEKDFQKVDYRKFSTPTLMNALKTLAKSKTPNVELQKGITRELLNRVKNKEGMAEGSDDYFANKIAQKKAEQAAATAEFRKYGVTARKHGGDDAYSWAVFINGRMMVNGLSSREVPYYKKEALKKAKETRGVAEGLPKAQDGRYNPDGSKKQAWHKDPKWQQRAKDFENDPKNIYGGVGKKKVKEQGVAEASDDKEPFDYAKWKASNVKPRKPRGYKDAEAIGQQQREIDKERKERKEQGVAEGWKEKLGGAAIGAAALGGIGALQNVAPNTTIQGRQAQLASSNTIPDNAKLVTDEKGNKVYVWSVSTTNPKSAGSGTKLVYRPAEQVNEKSKSQAQFRTMAAVAHNPEFAKKVGISQKVGKEFHSADKGSDYSKLPKKVKEGEVTRTSTGLKHTGDYPDYPKAHGAEFQSNPNRLNKSETGRLDKAFGVSWERKGGNKEVTGDPTGVNEAEVSEDKLASDLYRDLQIFKKGADKDIGSKAKDKEIGNKPQDKDIVAKEDCWDGYEQIGMKKKNGKTVPNCVPVKEEDVSEDWQKTNKQDKTDGMSPKAVKAYRRENPGSKLKTAVTKKPSELKAGSKDANRRKSFCARMSGNKGPMKDENGKPTPKAKALKRWNC